MADGVLADLYRSLDDVHDGLWDPEADLVRLAPGVNPGVDLSSLNLHAVRETAIGALNDLRRGNLSRAERGLRSVLDHQYLDTDVPWAGTFRVCAEEGAPPARGAEEWFHYDPNWRQFLGCILAFTLDRHADLLADDLIRDIEAAVRRAVEGEPADRIPAWYTNPNLMHAWLTAWAGVRFSNPDFVRAGEARRDMIMGRFTKHGDVDEYNSPTYDGIDLFAAALWLEMPPAPGFADAGEALVASIGARLSRLYHPGLGAICGPYIRAYGLSLNRYVSLAGQWLALADAKTKAVLPDGDAARRNSPGSLIEIPHPGRVGF